MSASRFAPRALRAARRRFRRSPLATGATTTRLPRRGCWQMLGAAALQRRRVPGRRRRSRRRRAVVVGGADRCAARWPCSRSTNATFRRAALAQLMAESERYVGTLSGGMDQAVCSAGARAGRALRIDFDPLRTRPVRGSGRRRDRRVRQPGRRREVRRRARGVQSAACSSAGSRAGARRLLGASLPGRCQRRAAPPFAERALATSLRARERCRRGRCDWRDRCARHGTAAGERRACVPRDLCAGIAPAVRGRSRRCRPRRRSPPATGAPSAR